MIPYGLLSQLSLLILGGAVVFTYVQPMFASITDVQNRISTYEAEMLKVSAVNAKLDELVASIGAVSSEDQRRLLTYIPNSVDTIAVPRDLEAIAAVAGVLVRQIKYEGPTGVDNTIPVTELEKMPEQHIFAFEFEGSYSQIKALLGLLEQNQYPLEVVEMNITKTEGGFLKVSSKIATYDRIIPLPEVVPALSPQ